MSGFRFYLPVEIRYADLDPQQHVNHARTLSFIEQARFSYLLKLGLWDGLDFLNVGLIVADVHVAYRAPIFLGQPVRVAARVSRIGSKSMVFEYQVEDKGTGQVLVVAETTMVGYDYLNHTSKPITQDWRNTISSFEGQGF